MVSITESAAKSILNIMARRGLDNTVYALDLRVLEGIAGIGFVKGSEINGIVETHHDLTVNIDPRILAGDDLYIDYGEVEGRRGLLFSNKPRSENVN